MTVPTPRRTAPRPPVARPAARGHVRRAGAAVALCLAAATAAAAPPAPATPTGCGELVRGQLCLRGPAGSAGTYTATYRRHGAPAPHGPRTTGGAPGPPGTRDEFSVRLGYQRRNDRITAFPGWFGTRRTVRGAAELSGRVEMRPDECIRGVMEHGAEVSVTAWSCG
ncbi:hypothetical protein [Streptomyces celluloflavus]|uniref:hypothetical protein n=1 Tax=Streptomyces celluloflavus TaxID=58344 RepID=UPI00346093BB|nr:hypothetical protein OG717_14170 [Streptomyces celluloflavus]